MDRLAVYGWTDATAPLLEALRQHGRLEAVAIGDERPAALVRARAATGLPGYQHVHEMARSAAFDVILVGAGAHAADIAETAAARGAVILLLGAHAGSEVLAAASNAARRYGGSFLVLRPWLRSRGYRLVTTHLSATPPDLLVLEAAEPRAPMRMLRDLVAFTSRILGTKALDVSATETGEAIEGAPLTVHIRFANGHAALLSARMALAPSFRLLASSQDRTLELRTRDGRTTIDESCTDGAVVPLAGALAAPLQAEALRREAQRVAAGGERELDALLAPGEAAILGAVERALAGAFAERVVDGPRSFQLLRGGRPATSPREAGPLPALSLVSP